MKLIETIVTTTSVRMRYADNADAAKASQWVDFQVPLADLKHPENQLEMNPEKLESQLLAEIHQAALRCARDALNNEMRRLSGLRGRVDR
jgi:hypothetical protein